MKSQAYRMAMLYDFYGDVLTDRQKEFYDLYYNEDLSLAEIAQDRDITRQGVRDAIKRAEQQLLEMEERLGLARRFQEIQKALTLICAFHILYSRRESQWHSRVWRKSLAIPLKSCAARASSPRRT